MAGITRLNRRLVLMFDGTWNERSTLTNVARMFEAIDDYKPDGYDDIPPKDYKGTEPVQLVKYLKGVGTSIEKVTKLAGGATGLGLSSIIKEGYCWLSNNYRDGDEIFVFGFSRGAYSARSLVSLVHRCGGVLRQKDRKTPIVVSEKILQDSYAMYMSYVVTTDGHGNDTNDENLNAVFKKKLKEFKREFVGRIHGPVKVKMLGVWDTVGALGIPDISLFKNNFLDNLINPFSRKHYEFHDQGLSCIVENAYHALALDEHREAFVPTLWTTQAPENKEVKQVWFIGSHANVGGGADPYGEDPDDLWQYSYIWMQANAAKLGLRFHWMYTYTATGDKIVDPTTSILRRRVSRTTPEDSYAHFAWTLYKRFYNRSYRTVVGSNGAKLHWSVKERIEQDVTYRPKSLHITDLIPAGCKIQFKEDETQLVLSTECPIEDEAVDAVVNQASDSCLPVERQCSCNLMSDLNGTTEAHSWLPWH